MTLRSEQINITEKAHLRGGPHVGDEDGLGAGRRVVQEDALVAVAAGSDSVEYGAVHAVL
jgi:hypothetical protein